MGTNPINFKTRKGKNLRSGKGSCGLYRTAPFSALIKARFLIFRSVGEAFWARYN